MLAATFVALLLIVALAGIVLAAAVLARHRAQGAADLAALAAAARVPGGADGACREARAVALAVGAALERCQVVGADVVVSVSVEPGVQTGGPARATARAGPAGPV